MHSATKYLAGHSDVMAGALIMKEEDRYANAFSTICYRTIWDLWIAFSA
jgi:cystathionine beta-lyase/cystathionine gamma-synthase